MASNDIVKGPEGSAPTQITRLRERGDNDRDGFLVGPGMGRPIRESGDALSGAATRQTISKIVSSGRKRREEQSEGDQGRSPEAPVAADTVSSLEPTTTASPSSQSVSACTSKARFFASPLSRGKNLMTSTVRSATNAVRNGADNIIEAAGTSADCVAETAISAARILAMGLAAFLSIVTVFALLLTVSATYGSFAAASVRWFFMRGAPEPETVVPLIFVNDAASKIQSIKKRRGGDETEAHRSLLVRGESVSDEEDEWNALGDLSLDMLEHTVGRLSGILRTATLGGRNAERIMDTDRNEGWASYPHEQEESQESRRRHRTRSSPKSARRAPSTKFARSFPRLEEDNDEISGFFDDDDLRGDQIISSPSADHSDVQTNRQCSGTAEEGSGALGACAIKNVAPNIDDASLAGQRERAVHGREEGQDDEKVAHKNRREGAGRRRGGNRHQARDSLALASSDQPFLTHSIRTTKAEELLQTLVVQKAMSDHNVNYEMQRLAQQEKLEGFVGAASVRIGRSGDSAIIGRRAHDSAVRSVFSSSSSIFLTASTSAEGKSQGNDDRGGRSSDQQFADLLSSSARNHAEYSVSLIFESSVSLRADLKGLALIQKAARALAEYEERSAKQNFISKFVFGERPEPNVLTSSTAMARDGTALNELDLYVVALTSKISVPLSIETSVESATEVAEGQRQREEAEGGGKPTETAIDTTSTVVSKAFATVEVDAGAAVESFLWPHGTQSIARLLGRRERAAGHRSFFSSLAEAILPSGVLLPSQQRRTINSAGVDFSTAADRSSTYIGRLITFSVDSVVYFALLPFTIGSHAIAFSLEWVLFCFELAQQGLMWLFFGWARVAVSTIRSTMDFIFGFWPASVTPPFPESEMKGFGLVNRDANAFADHGNKYEREQYVTIDYPLPRPTTVLVTDSFSPTEEFLKSAENLRFEVTRKLAGVSELLREARAAATASSAMPPTALSPSPIGLSVSDVTITRAHLTLTPRITGIQYYFYHYPFACFATIAIANGLFCFFLGLIVIVALLGVMYAQYSSGD